MFLRPNWIPNAKCYYNDLEVNKVTVDDAFKNW